MRKSKIIEWFIWILLAFLFGWRILFFIVANVIEGYRIPMLYEFYSDIIFSLIIIIFPVIFQVIFSALPFEYLRIRNKERTKEKTERQIHKVYVEGDANIVIQDQDNKQNITNRNDKLYLLSLAQDSQKLADKVFSRSGLYLLVGSLIALIGIIYFSIQSIDISTAHTTQVQELRPSTSTEQSVTSDSKETKQDDLRNISFDKSTITSSIILLLPRIGALLFIELIAFFFLKQYRITMDEFRYFESIKRQRESDYAKLLLIENSDNKDEMISLIEKMSIDSSFNEVEKEKSKELIELRKTDIEQYDLLSKIIDKIPKIK